MIAHDACQCSSEAINNMQAACHVYRDMREQALCRNPVAGLAHDRRLCSCIPYLSIHVV